MDATQHSAEKPRRLRTESGLNEHLERHKSATGPSLPISYHDLGNSGHLTEWGMTEKDAAMRLHVRKEGQIYGGIPAFLVLWQDIPQMRWLARLVRLPGVYWLACAFYDFLLAPLLYRWHLARVANRSE